MKSLPVYILSCCLLCSCVTNDLPLPVIKGDIASLEIEGALEVDINSENRTVDIVLDESVDLSAVRISSVEYKHQPTESKPEIKGLQDLRKPLEFTLSTWQDYSWTMRASQLIERSFSVSGQIGQSVIDDVNRRVIAYVGANADLSDILVTGLKLGPSGITTYDPDPSQLTDFSQGVAVNVDYRGNTETWMLYLEQSDFTIRLDSVDPWTCCAYAWASAPEGSEVVLEYRAAGDSVWNSITALCADGGTFYALMDSLSPLSVYECRALCNGDYSETREFTTEEAQQLPNAGFNTFSNAESAVFSSWFNPASAEPELAAKWWDSGNIGSTTLGSAYCIAIPDTSDYVEGNTSALLVSRNVIVKFAAGNTFSGEFAGLVGASGGILNFGRPWNLRPRSVRLWINYTGGTIDIVDGFPEDQPVSKGDPDQCSIWVALGNWDYRKFGGTPSCPVQVNTTDRETFFNPESPSVIAYGSYFRAEATEGWMQVEIPMEYRYENRKPTHIIVSLASSRWGDYFTGSSQSRLGVDDIELIY